MKRVLIVPVLLAMFLSACATAPTPFQIPTSDTSTTPCGSDPAAYSRIVKIGEYFQYGSVRWTVEAGGVVSVNVGQIGPWQVPKEGEVQPGSFKGVCLTLLEDGSVRFSIRPPVETPTPGPTPTVDLRFP